MAAIPSINHAANARPWSRSWRPLSLKSLRISCSTAVGSKASLWFPVRTGSGITPYGNGVFAWGPLAKKVRYTYNIELYPERL